MRNTSNMNFPKSKKKLKPQATEANVDAMLKRLSTSTAKKNRESSSSQERALDELIISFD